MTDMNMIIAELENMGIEARATEVNKNGTIKHGISIGNGNVRPVVYVDTLEGTPKEIAEQVAKIAEDASPVNIGDVKSLVSRENILETVKAKVVPVTSYLENKVYREFLDLAICYYIPVEGVEGGVVNLTKDICKNAKITEKQLFKAAMKHTTTRIKDMVDIMVEMMGMPEEMAEMMGGRGQQIVITNMDKHLGAIALAGNLDEVCEILGTDEVYILPSSIHELIAVRANEPVEGFRNMVSEVNDTQVAPEERLSYNVYAYKRGGEIAIA